MKADNIQLNFHRLLAQQIFCLMPCTAITRSLDGPEGLGDFLPHHKLEMDTQRDSATDIR
jgi:hypothetical protein